MSSINGVGQQLSIHALGSVVGSHKLVGSAPTATPPARTIDRVELSEVSGYLQTLKSNDVRADKVAAAKAAIAAGNYEDDYKLDVASDRLLEDLDA